MKKRLIWTALLGVYILFVFSNSLTPAAESARNSGFVLGLVHHALELIGVSGQGITEHIIRKTAHFAEYAGLGILLHQVLFSYSLRKDQILMLRFGAAFFIPFVDETLQLFTPGRSGQISDVWLDACGAVFGMVFIACLTAFIHAGKGKKID